jgi:hypothetical protein
MKAPVLLVIALAGACLASGCARFYNITTNSGRTIMTRGKPHYDRENSVFVFTDVRGEKRTIPAGSVAQIAPAEDKSSPTGFNPKSSR